MSDHRTLIEFDKELDISISRALSTLEALDLGQVMLRRSKQVTLSTSYTRRFISTSLVALRVRLDH